MDLVDEDVNLSVGVLSHDVQFSDLNVNLLDESSFETSQGSATSGEVSVLVVSALAESTGDSGVLTAVPDAG